MAAVNFNNFFAISLSSTALNDPDKARQEIGICVDPYIPYVLYPVCSLCLPNQRQQETGLTGFQSRKPVYICTFGTVKFKVKIGLFMLEDIEFQ
eukprot:5655100-Ditylum_brightwellii.AAC.1